MALKNNKSLGQHWLKNRIILDDIADFAVVDGVRHCLDSGPARGAPSTSLLRLFETTTVV